MKALIIENIQIDFAPGGAFDEIERPISIEQLNTLINQFEVVIATKTAYPALHQSFAANHPWRKPGQTIEIDGLPQELNIMHCVEGSFGSLLVKGLHKSKIAHTIQKGIETHIDVDNAFYDFGNQRDTGLEAWLKEHSITSLQIEGWTKSVEKSRKVAIEKGFNLINE